MKLINKEQIKSLQTKLNSAFNIPNLLDFYTKIDNEYWVIMNDLLADECYSFYEHPVHEYKNKTYVSTREEVIIFLKEKISPQIGEGLDITVTDTNFTHFFVFNHDGDIFYYTPISEV